MEESGQTQIFRSRFSILGQAPSGLRSINHKKFMTKYNIKIRTADWEKDKNQLTKIRRLVFIDEQKVPEEMEWDEFDESSTHFLASYKSEEVACARLKTDSQIGRMAVLPAYRNHGTGSKLLRFILKYAAEQQLKQVTLHAQTTAIAFYEKHGFTVNSELFYEANIPHRKMLLIIP